MVNIMLDGDNWYDSPTRLAEIEQEEIDAKLFGISIEQLRKQRRSLGQLLTGPYAGCSPGFARTIELLKQVDCSLK